MTIFVLEMRYLAGVRKRCNVVTRFVRRLLISLLDRSSLCLLSLLRSSGRILSVFFVYLSPLIFFFSFSGGYPYGVSLVAVVLASTGYHPRTASL